MVVARRPRSVGTKTRHRNRQRCLFETNAGVSPTIPPVGGLTRTVTRQLIAVDIPVDGEALVQNKIGQNVDPLAEGPGLDVEPVVAEERVVQR